MTEFPLFPSAYWAEHASQQTAVVWEKGDSSLFDFLPSQISWQSWHQLVAQVATLLQTKGVTQGQIVAYNGSHRLSGLLCYSAVIALGAKILMLNPAMAESQRRTLFKQHRVALLMNEHEFAKFSAKLTACHLPVWESEKPATLTLTSGSSSTPKAVVHNARQHLANAQGVCEFMQFSENHRWLLSLPLFHVSGQGIVWRWLSVGATLYLAENKADIERMLQQVSHASLVPTQLQRYLRQLAPIARLPQHILLGGASIPAELIKTAQQYQITTYAGYGMTEMASTICAVKNDTDNVGKPLFGREVCIVNDEIWVRGAGLALGYWQQDQIVSLLNQQGWFATKDKGQWNSEGKLVVLGRLDNMFISGGENIQPEEIESILAAMPQVKSIFVVPVKDHEFGQRPVALVDFQQPFNQQAVTLLQNFAKNHLEKFKQPVCYLPLNSEQWQNNGIKISRKQLTIYVENQLREKND